MMRGGVSKDKFRRDPIVVIPHGRVGEYDRLLNALQGIYDSDIIKKYPGTNVVVVGFEKYAEVNEKLEGLFGKNSLYVSTSDVLDHLTNLGYDDIAHTLTGYSYGNIRNIALIALAMHYNVGITDNVPILWVDDDCIPKKGWYKEHLEFLGIEKDGKKVIATVGQYNGAGASVDVDVLYGIARKGGNFKGLVPPNNTRYDSGYVRYLLGGNMGMLGLPPVPFVPGIHPIRDEEGILAEELVKQGYLIRSVKSSVKHNRYPVKDLDEAVELAYWSRVSAALEDVVIRGDNTEDAIRNAVSPINDCIPSLYRTSKNSRIRRRRREACRLLIAKFNDIKGKLENEGERVISESIGYYNSLKKKWKDNIDNIRQRKCRIIPCL